MDQTALMDGLNETLPFATATGRHFTNSEWPLAWQAILNIELKSH